MTRTPVHASEWLRPHQRIGIAVCSPNRKVILPSGEEMLETITVEWHRRRTALSFPTNTVMIELFADGMEVGEAKSGAAERCLTHTPQPEFLFLLDNDVLADWDALTKLYAHARWRPDHDIFAGVYCCKFQNPADPLIYAGDGAGGFWDWAVGDILTTEGHGITSVHSGLTLIRTSLFRRIREASIDDPFFFTQEKEQWRVNGALRSKQGTEDIWFCNLARKIGAKILVDTSVLAGHIDKNRGITYGLHPKSPPVKRAKWLTGDDKKEATHEHDSTCSCVIEHTARADCKECDGTGKIRTKLLLALDLGAGGTRREWSGYKTYTLDIRPDAKPDYCQDSRQLNFPDGHWDMVCSSHHLEHIGRWDQEQVWKEMVRVLKPGGTMEHIVPSVEWAARKIGEGEVDEHVVNVLYGAQEVHGYAREWNLHYFGYTKAVAKALAEQSGLVEVEMEDWRDQPGLGYNLVIRARKPLALPAPEENRNSERNGETRSRVAERSPIEAVTTP